MKKGIKAFSLTELMIVIVIIAIIFSALAPIVTKRHISDSHDSESVWNLVSGDSEYNAYFDPGEPKWTSSVYVGMMPGSTNNNAGKLVVNSGDISYNSKTYKQPQIQFRFSKTPSEQTRGINAASLFVGPSSNVVFGSALPYTDTSYSTVYGLSNLHTSVQKNDGTNSPLSKAKYVTVMGHSAMGKAKITESDGAQYIIAIGNSSANKIGAANTTSSISGIYIGSGAGSGSAESAVPPSNNIAIGYNSMAYTGKNVSSGILGSNNVVIGADSGNTLEHANSSYNTIIGSNYVGKKVAYSTIIGYGAYANGNSITANITAIGYGACNSVKGDFGSRVCIGYNSGVSANNTPDVFNTDSGEHIFIGGRPQYITSQSTYPGRSVLEVHNNTVGSNTYGNVVLNSNLVVRGNFYPSDGDNIAYNVFKTTHEVSAERSYYRCNSDTFRSTLDYSSYVCNDLTSANPKSINLLYKGGNCNLTEGYTNGGNCPNIISSDIRLKTDISENYDGLEKILELKPYNFYYKNDLSTPMVGVIAQDLQKVFPDAVSKDSKGFLQIRFEDMFYALVNAVKQLSDKIDSIGEKLADVRQSIIKVKSDQADINRDLSLLNIKVKKLEKKWGVNGNN